MANPRPSEGRKATLIDYVMLAIFFASVIGLMVLFNRESLPRFQLESVSVSVHNNTAAWDIGFSIDQAVGDLDVWIRFMAQDFKAGSVGSVGKWTVSVSTSLPPGFDLSTAGGLTLEQVAFNCNDCGDISRYILKAECKDVAVVGFWSNETVADLKGGPRLCPLFQIFV